MDDGHDHAAWPCRCSGCLRPGCGRIPGVAKPVAQATPQGHGPGTGGSPEWVGAACAGHSGMAGVGTGGRSTAHGLSARTCGGLRPTHAAAISIGHARGSCPWGLAGGGSGRRGRCRGQPELRCHACPADKLVVPDRCAAAADTKGRRCSLSAASCSSCCWPWLCW